MVKYLARPPLPVPPHNPDGTLLKPFERWDPVLACAHMPFVVSTLASKKYTFIRWGDFTLGQLRQSLKRAMGMPVPAITIVYRGRTLHKARAQLVRDYGVVPGESCYVVIRRSKLALYGGRLPSRK